MEKKNAAAAAASQRRRRPGARCVANARAALRQQRTANVRTRGTTANHAARRGGVCTGAWRQLRPEEIGDDERPVVHRYMVRTARPRLVRVPRTYSAWRLGASCPAPLVRTACRRLVRVARMESTVDARVSTASGERIGKRSVGWKPAKEWHTLCPAFQLGRSASELAAAGTSDSAAASMCHSWVAVAKFEVAGSGQACAKIRREVMGLGRTVPTVH